MKTIILILLAVVSFSGIFLAVFGIEKLTWRYYLRKILSIKPDLKDVYPYTQMFSGQKMGSEINDYTEISPICFNTAKYGRELELHIMENPDNPKKYLSASIVSHQDNLLNKSIGGRIWPIKMGASIMVPAKKNVRTIIGLSSKKDNAGMPVVLMDCPNETVLNFFGKKMVKVYFTAVEDYGDNDEAHFKTFLWIPANKYFYLRFEADQEGLRWYLNNYLVKYHPNSLPKNYTTKTVAAITATGRLINLEKETLKIKF